MEQTVPHKITQPKRMLEDDIDIQWSPLPKVTNIDIGAERHPEEQIVERGSSDFGAFGRFEF